MKNNIFQKHYIALVNGNLPIDNEIKTIDTPIKRKSDSIIERIVSLDGEKAITKYKVIKNYKDYSELEIRLLTGRTHQIRVHFQSIGHSILGDTLYGEKSNLIDRQALHAYKSSFNHPITKQLVEIKATIPNDIKALL